MSSWKTSVVVALVLGIVVGIGLTLSFSSPALAVGEKGGAGGGGVPSYSVVHTEGHNLIVTDNKANILYFYTIDKDAAIGSDLKMRGQVDLSQVGKAVVRPSKAKAE